MDEQKEGPIQSLQEVAQQLSNAIREKNNKKVQTILNSFKENYVADATVELLSEGDFKKLIKLQKNANETITTDDIDTYVTTSDRIATGLLCLGRTADQSLTRICNHIDSILKTAQTTTANTVNKINEMIEQGTHLTDEIFQITYNSYDHARWFFQTVLSNSSDGEEVPIKQHIRNKYGHLLFIYDHESKEFDYNDALTNYLMPLVIKKLQNKKRPTSASDKKVEESMEKEADELYKKNQHRSNSSPAVLTRQEIQEGQVQILEDQQVAIIESNIQPDIQLEDQQVAIIESNIQPDIEPNIQYSNPKKRNRNEITEFVPRIEMINRLKRKIEDEIASRKKTKTENGGKPRRQTRRKIRRNKKAKTKKRKANKKTKKRKMKTKVNRKKSKRRRTKK